MPVSILVVVDLSHCPPVGEYLDGTIYLFQSLLSWICLTAQIVKDLDIIKEEVSILVVVDLSHCLVTEDDTHSPTLVSILVVVDLSHCPLAISSGSGQLDLFQSLLSWICLTALQVYPMSFLTNSVSILVVVDLSHCLIVSIGVSGSLLSFNPCCRGSVSLPFYVKWRTVRWLGVSILVVVDLSHCPKSHL